MQARTTKLSGTISIGSNFELMPYYLLTLHCPQRHPNITAYIEHETALTPDELAEHTTALKRAFATKCESLGVAPNCADCKLPVDEVSIKPIEESTLRELLNGE
jgi:hypothetical protein